MSGLTPQLTPEERAAREERLEAKHKEFLRAVSTSHSLPNQQSSTAGAGGTTNQKLRMAEDHEAERLLKMKLAAELLAREKKAQAILDEKSAALASRQQKKKAKRAKKESAKKSKPNRGEDSASSNDSSVEGE
jgi:ClpP class serine protease